MAEERLIDEDKDRKYKIRKNADGEEELVLIDGDGDAEEEESDIPVFEIPVYEEDDEEAAILTPEQLAERDRIKEEEEKSREEHLETMLASVREKVEAGDFAAAEEKLEQAEEFALNSGSYYFWKLRVSTRDFTDYSALEESAEAADGVKDYAAENSKKQLKSLASGLGEKITVLETEVSKLGEENAAKKEERRVLLLKNKSRSFKTLLCCAVPFLALLIAAIVFSTMMFADEHGTYLIVTIVLASFALIAFICLLVAANIFWTASRNCTLNEKDTSTKLGRDYLKNKTELELLKRIYAAVND